MAILWQKKQAGTHYEVRSAGKSIRLYSNGVFHSQWNARRVIADALWDLLVVPGFFLRPGQLQRVLVLGVGGGAAVMQLRALFNPQDIQCVELDCTHVQIARKWFGLNGDDIQLHQAEARQWLCDYDGPPFDYIIDDLFGHRLGVAERAILVDENWASSLCKNLSENGLLVINFATQREFGAALGSLYQTADARWSITGDSACAIFGFSHSRYHNRIAALTRCTDGDSARSLRDNMRQRIFGCRQLTASQKRIAAGFRCRIASNG